MSIVFGKTVFTPIMPAVYAERARRQLSMLHNSMLTKDVILLRQFGKVGYVTCLETEDGSGHCWFVTLHTGERFFVRLSEPDVVMEYVSH